MKTSTLGSFLNQARREVNLSQVQVAERLGLSSSQSVSDWERNHGSTIPLKTLKRLIKIYKLNKDHVFKVLLKHQIGRLEEKIRIDFYGKTKKTGRSTR